MAKNFDITAADMTAWMTVDDLFPGGFPVEGFAADSAISVSDHSTAETRFGVDGKLVAGYTPTAVEVTIDLEANSATAESLQQLRETMATSRRVYSVNLTVTLPSRKSAWTFANGVLKTGNIMPGAKKILEPTKWAFDFESCNREGTE
jgi:hypothetical protein